MATLRRSVRGEVLTPADPGYDTVRRVRNARVDRRPSLILRCGCVEDVVEGIAYARAQGLPVAVRGGGAHVAGWATCDEGVLLDLGPMNRITVASEARLATAEGGVYWGDFDIATQKWGLAIPGTRIPTIGIAGHTLGGGVGDLSRQFGLTCDNSTFFDLVTAGGEVVRASAEENPELFWGLRGGGGNFGVVTRFGFRLHPTRQVCAGTLAYPLNQARTILPCARDWLEAAPDEASLIAIVWTAPPAPLVPDWLHFERCVVLIPTWFGAPERAEEIFAPLRHGKAKPIFDGIRPMSYLDYHRVVPAPPNYMEQHVYNRGEMLTELSDETIDRLVELFEESGPNFSFVFGALGGAIARVPAHATAYPYRSAKWFVEICAQWFGHPHDIDHLTPAVKGWRALRAVSSGPYTNLLPDPEPEWVHAAYGPNYQRLLCLKQSWDPENVFRFNANLRPDDLAAHAVNVNERTP